jgi:hypothetical protein
MTPFGLATMSGLSPECDQKRTSSPCRNQQQRLHRGLRFFGIVFRLGQVGDVERGAAQGEERLPLRPNMPGFRARLIAMAMDLYPARPEPANAIRVDSDQFMGPFFPFPMSDSGQTQALCECSLIDTREAVMGEITLNILTPQEIVRLKALLSEVILALSKQQRVGG